MPALTILLIAVNFAAFGLVALAILADLPLGLTLPAILVDFALAYVSHQIV